MRLVITSSWPNTSALAQKLIYPKKKNKPLETGTHDRERNRGVEVLTYRKGETGTQLSVDMLRLGKYS